MMSKIFHLLVRNSFNLWKLCGVDIPDKDKVIVIINRIEVIKCCEIFLNLILPLASMNCQKEEGTLFYDISSVTPLGSAYADPSVQPILDVLDQLLFIPISAI